jgi:hypothetical protein
MSERPCVMCAAPITRRPDEDRWWFDRRQTCKPSCAYKLRARNRYVALPRTEEREDIMTLSQLDEAGRILAETIVTLAKLTREARAQHSNFIAIDGYMAEIIRAALAAEEEA